MSNSVNLDEIVSIIEDDIEDEDELDLIKLIASNVNDKNQYLLFLGSDNQYYAINISKVEELLIYKDLDIVFNHDEQSNILGTTYIRNEMTSVVSFDKWAGNKVLSADSYEHAIITSYNTHKLALVVREVEHIATIDSDDMRDNSGDNSKSNFIAQIQIEGENRLCTIFKDIEDFVA